MLYVLTEILVAHINSYALRHTNSRAHVAQLPPHMSFAQRWSTNSKYAEALKRVPHISAVYTDPTAPNGIYSVRVLQCLPRSRYYYTCTIGILTAGICLSRAKLLAISDQNVSRLVV